MLTTGTATTLESAPGTWLAAKSSADRQSAREVDDATTDALSRSPSPSDQLDVLATSLDGVREQLLGLVYDGGLVRERQHDTLDLNLSGDAAPDARRHSYACSGRASSMPRPHAALPVEQLRAPQRLVVAPALAGRRKRRQPAGRRRLRLPPPDAAGAAEVECFAARSEEARGI